jgi:hypothetical protein
LGNLPGGAGHERRFVNEALIILQARQVGASLLTGNIRDFDLLTQIVSSARIILYRTSPDPRQA